MAGELKPKSTASLSAAHRELKAAIKAAAARPRGAPQPADGPIVIADTRPHMYHLGRQIVYSVVWDRFKDIDGETRFLIVYYALREALPPEVVMKVTAMEAYTREEAARFDLKF